MTTAQLIGYVQRYHYFAEKRINVGPDTVYLAGSWSQNEICSSLMPLEKKITLTTVASQEQYQYSPGTVTGGTATTPIRLTVTAHPFSTGDMVYISGIVGLTGASGWFTITKIGANTIELDDSIGGGSWTSGGTVYHGLSAAVDIKLIARAETPFGTIKRKIIHTIEDERGYFANDAGEQITDGKLVSYDIIYDNPIVLSFQPEPAAAETLKLIIWRRPLPTEALSSSVNPILPTQFDKLLYRATLCQVFEILQLDDPQAERAQAKAQVAYEQEAALQIATLASTRRVRKEATKTFNW
jgi:hypothetical protein